jgi:TolB-like protein
MYNMEQIKKRNGDQFLIDIQNTKWFYVFVANSKMSFRVQKNDVLAQAERKKIHYAVTTCGSDQIMMIE